MRRNRLVLFLVITLFATGLAAAQDADRRPLFVGELLDLLAEDGWTPDEVAALAGSTASMDWSELEKADPEVVALALSYYREQRGEDAVPGDAAIIAHELALTVMVMEQNGFGAVQVARATLEGTRDALASRGDRAPDAEGSQQSLEVRNRIVLRVREQVGEIANGRGPGVAREVMRRIGELSEFGPAAGDFPTGTPGDGSGPR